MRIFLFGAVMVLISFKAASQAGFRLQADSLTKKPSIRVLPQNFYTKQMGFACKAEWKLQKISSLPLYLRLGSKDYVDLLEKKGRLYQPPPSHQRH